MSDEQKRRFRLRSPSRSMENWEVIPGMELEMWDEALVWIKHVDPKRIQSFRLQVNYRRESKQSEKP